MKRFVIISNDNNLTKNIDFTHNYQASLNNSHKQNNRYPHIRLLFLPNTTINITLLSFACGEKNSVTASS